MAVKGTTRQNLTGDFYLTSRAKTRILLLRTLWFMAHEDLAPTSTELVYAIDARDKIPRNTVKSRREMINEMIKQGFIGAENIPGERHRRLFITEDGVAKVREVDKRS